MSQLQPSQEAAEEKQVWSGLDAEWPGGMISRSRQEHISPFQSCTGVNAGMSDWIPPPTQNEGPPASVLGTQPPGMAGWFAQCRPLQQSCQVEEMEEKCGSGQWLLLVRREAHVTVRPGPASEAVCWKQTLRHGSRGHSRPQGRRETPRGQGCQGREAHDDRSVIQPSSLEATGPDLREALAPGRTQDPHAQLLFPGVWTPPRFQPVMWQMRVPSREGPGAQPSGCGLPLKWEGGETGCQQPPASPNLVFSEQPGVSNFDSRTSLLSSTHWSPLRNTSF